MEHILNFFINIAFSVTILIWLSIYEKIEDEYKISSLYFYIFWNFYLIILFSIIYLGYGNLITVIISAIVVLCIEGFYFIASIVDLEFRCKIYKYFYPIIQIFMIVFVIILFFYRLKSEKIFEKKIVFNILNTLKNISFLEIFQSIINNEWFRGICTGIIVTVFGGLILNKITKNK